MTNNNSWLAAALAAALSLFLFAAPASAEWGTWTQTDEMDGTSRRGASSDWTTPTRELRGLGSHWRLVAGFGCPGDGPLTSFYFRFQGSPSLVDQDGDYLELKGDGHKFFTRFKFDDAAPIDGMLRLWRSGDGVKVYDRETDSFWRDLVSRSSEMLVEFRVREGPVVFRVDLSGAAAALREAGCLPEAS